MTFFDWLETILFMGASIGALLIGFEMLGDNITKLAHRGLKKLFNKTSNNKLAGVGIGCGATLIMQSSSSTTILIVGFVNAGVMTLYQATSMIMGCNIGTTITAQLASLSGGNSFNFGAYALGLAGVGTFLSMFTKKEKIKTLGKALAGFGILFFGLECMSTCIKTDEVKQVISTALQSISGPGAGIILFLLGALICGLVQSSSLITSIVISLASAGVFIGVSAGANQLNNNVLYLIMGTNIGTCITAIISSLGAGTNAKRASLIHLLFNFLGSVIFGIFLMLYPNFMEDTFVKMFALPQTQIAMFHTFFNVVCTIIFLPFVNLFVKISEKVIKDHEETHEEKSYIDTRMLKSTSVALHQVRKEMDRMYKKAYKNLMFSLEGFINKDYSCHDKVEEVNHELEETSKKVIEYLVLLSNENLVFEDECSVSSFHRIMDDILRIGEIGDNICKYTRRVIRDDLNLSEQALQELDIMKDNINKLYGYTSEIFMTKDLSKLDIANETEENIDNLRKLMVDHHFERLNRGECVPTSSGVFVNLVNNLERSADHMMYVVENVQLALENSKKN